MPETTYLGRLQYLIGANTTEFDAGMARTKAGLGGLTGLLTPLNLGLAGVGVGLGLVGSKAIGMASDFEDAFAEVSTILDQTREQNELLKESILDLSEVVPESAAKLTKGVYQAISAGATNAADAMIVVERASKLAAAGLSDTFTTVDALTTILNAYGLEATEVGRISSQMFETVRLGKIQLDELAGSIGKAAPFFASLDIATEELFAAVATLTKGGLDADIVMTSLRATITQVLKPQKEAVELAREMGFEYSAAALKAKGLWGWLQEVARAVGDDQEALAQLFPNVRGLLAILGLVGKQADTFTQSLDAIGRSVDADIVAFDKMSETLSFQWDLLKNRVSRVFIELGTVAIPAVNKAITAASSLFDTKAEKMAKRTEELRTELERLDKTVMPLARRYDELTSAGDLNEEQQKELKDIMDKLRRETIPGLVAEINAHGEATRLNTDAIRENRLELAGLYSRERAAEIELQVEKVLDQQDALERLAAEWRFAAQARDAGWTGSAWQKVLTSMDLGIARLLTFNREMLQQETHLIPLWLNKLAAWSRAQTEINQDIQRGEAELEEYRGELQLMATGFALQGLIQRYIELKDAAEGGPLSAEGIKELKELQSLLSGPLPSLFDPATAERALELWREILGVMGQIGEAVDPFTGTWLQTSKAAQAIVRQSSDELRRLLAGWKTSAEEGAAGAAKALSPLELKLQDIRTAAEDDQLELVRLFAALVMGVEDGTDSLENFRKVFAQMSAETQAEMVEMAEQWKKTWGAGVTEPIGPTPMWELPDVQRQLTGLREQHGRQRIKPWQMQVEPVLIDASGNVIDMKKWRKIQQELLAAPILMNIKLLLEMETGRAESALGVLGGVLNQLGEHATGATGAIADILIPGIDNWIYKMQEWEEVSEGVFQQVGWEKALPQLFGGLFQGILGGIFDTIFGGAKDAAREAARQRRALEQATDALNRFVDAARESSLAELRAREAQLGSMMDDYRRLAEARERYERAKEAGDVPDPDYWVEQGKFIREYGPILRELGLPETWTGIEQLPKMLEATRDELEKFVAFDMDTFTGRLAALRWEFDLLDKTEDPSYKLRRLREEIEELTEGKISLPEFDITTGRGRRQMELLLKYLSGLEELAEKGTEEYQRQMEELMRVTGLGQDELERLLRDLPAQLRAGEALELARYLESILDELEEGRAVDEEGNEIIERSRKVEVTEQQFETGLTLDRERNAVLWDILSEARLISLAARGAFAEMGRRQVAAAAQSIVGASPVVVGGGGSSLTVEVGDIINQFGTAPANAIEAAVMGTEIRNNVIETLTRRVRAAGGSIRRI